MASRRLAVGSAGSRHRAVGDFGMALGLYGLVLNVFAYRAGAALSARGCAGRLFGDRPFAVLVTRRLNDSLRLDDLAAYRAVASRRFAVGSAGSRHRFVGDYGVSLSLNDRLLLYDFVAYRAVASRRLAVSSAGSRHRAVGDFGVALSLYSLVLDVFANRAGARLSARGGTSSRLSFFPCAVFMTRGGYAFVALFAADGAGTCANALFRAGRLSGYRACVEVVRVAADYCEGVRRVGIILRVNFQRYAAVFCKSKPCVVALRV